MNRPQPRTAIFSVAGLLLSSLLRAFVCSALVGPGLRPIFAVSEAIRDAARAKPHERRTFARHAPALRGATGTVQIAVREFDFSQVFFHEGLLAGTKTVDANGQRCSRLFSDCRPSWSAAPVPPNRIGTPHERPSLRPGGGLRARRGRRHLNLPVWSATPCNARFQVGGTVDSRWFNAHTAC